MNIIRGFKRLGYAAKKGSPWILTGAAILGVGTTATLAVKATPGAMEDLKKAAEKKQRETGNPDARLTRVEAVQVAAPHYIPAGISGLLTSGCMFMATRIGAKRAAAAGTAAIMAQNALSDYSEKVAEKFGKEKETEVRDEVIADKMKEQPVSTAMAKRTSFGDHLCYEVYSGRYFYSDVEELRRAMNDFNQRLLYGDCLSLNEWYFRIGLDPVTYGYDVDWDANDHLMDLRFGTQLADNGEPCLTVDFVSEMGPSVHNYSR